MAKTRASSKESHVAEAIETRIEAEKRKQQDLSLAERFRKKQDSETTNRRGDESGSMVFGGGCRKSSAGTICTKVCAPKNGARCVEKSSARVRAHFTGGRFCRHKDDLAGMAPRRGFRQNAGTIPAGRGGRSGIRLSRRLLRESRAAAESTAIFVVLLGAEIDPSPRRPNYGADDYADTLGVAGAGPRIAPVTGCYLVSEQLFSFIYNRQIDARQATNCRTR
jgi:hypothetical protein